MKESAEALRRARRGLGILTGLLALAVPALLPGCSKSPTAPVVPGPTRFMVLSSDRTRTAGSLRTWFATIDGASIGPYVFNASASVIERHPSITQDGNVIAYEKAPGRGNSHDVILYTRKPVASTDDPNVNTLLDEIDPYISLDGKRLAFVRDTVGGKRIRLYDLTTHTLIPLPNLDAPTGKNDSAPALDATGKRIAFVTDRDGTADVFVYQVTTGTFLPMPLSASGGSEIEPSLSGDGRFVAWSSDISPGLGGYDIYLWDLSNDLEVSHTANTAANDRDPSLSFDGSYFVYASDFHRPNWLGGYDVWTVTLANGSITAVAGQNSTADDLDPVLVWP